MPWRGCASITQCSKAATNAVKIRQVVCDVLLVTRHSTHVTISKNLHKLVLIKMGKRSFYGVIL